MTSNHQSLWYIFRHSRFYLSVLLVVTFVCFIIVPDLILLFYNLKVVIVSQWKIPLKGALIFFGRIAFLSDAGIYIFAQNQVRKLLWRKLHAIGLLRNITPLCDGQQFTMNNCRLSVIQNDQQHRRSSGSSNFGKGGGASALIYPL